MDQHKTPLYDALIKYKERAKYSFHVPGHKNGMSFPDRGKDEFESVLRIDVTEVEGLDDLFHPRGVIKEAQDLLTSFYNTKKSCFLVNGTTSGNLAMILATCHSKEKVLVQRNSHKSIFNGLRLSGAHPIFLTPEIDSMTMIPTGVNEATLDKALQHFPEARVLILTHPNYYGMAYDYQSVINKAHDNGLLVLVDEAHGAHFGIAEDIPNSTLKMGADIVVQSAHKMLPAMTMGSFLHINSEQINIAQVEKYLSVIQTSSPSYPIMASLDLARYSLATITQDQLKLHMEHIDIFKQQLKSIPQLKVIESTSDPHTSFDPFKLLIRTECELNAIECQQELLSEGIYIELADGDYMLLTLPVYPTESYQNSALLIKRTLSSYTINNKTMPSFRVNLKPFSYLTVDYKSQDTLPTQSIVLSDAIGGVSSQDIIPYPPGIPLLLRGEMVTLAHIQLIEYLIKDGVRFQGIEFNNKRMIEIFDYNIKGPSK